MTEEELSKLIELWDKEEYVKQLESPPEDPDEHRTLKEKENFHKRCLDEILFLAKHFYNEYELNRSGDFKDIFLNWLRQFDNFVFNGGIIKEEVNLNMKSRYAFLLTTKILFISRLQMLALTKIAWESIKMELLNLASKANGLSIIDTMVNVPFIEEQFYTSIFLPLSDSSRFMEFRHVLPEGAYEAVTIPCIDRLILPIELEKPEYIKLINKTHKGKNNLFIIEDFSGSGTSAYRKIESIIRNYDFRNIYFVPLLTTVNAKETLSGLKRIANKYKKRFKIIPGMCLDKGYSLAHENESEIWTEGLKNALRTMSEEYFRSHFYENGYLYTEKNIPTPLGYKNGGLSIVLYSNCPNNSLPLIWEDSKGWNPLFRRHERYRKRMKK